MTPLPVRARARAGGFTLSELLIVLVIVGLLAAFGLPAMLRYGQNNRMKAVQQTLRQIAARETQWLAAHHAYAGLERLGFPVDASQGALYMDADGAVLGYATRASVYRVDLRIGAGAGDGQDYYLLTAEPMNQQSGDTRCRTLSLASTGQTGATGTAGEAGCWQ